MNNKNTNNSEGKSKKKSRYRITTLENFYRPKTFDKRGHTYNRFMKQFIDKRTFGINNKQHYHSTDYINDCLTSNSHFKRKLCESKVLHQLRHLNEDKYWLYYTNSPHTNIPLFCMDIDPIKVKDPITDDDIIISTPEDMQKVAEFLSTLHPDCYYEPSSSGHGLHFYFMVDFTRYRKAYRDEWSLIANSVIQNDDASYGKIIKEYVNNLFNVKFDAIKATVSHYSYSKEYSYYLIDNQAVLCKQPAPETVEDALRLFNAPIFPIEYLMKNADWLIAKLYEQEIWKDKNLKEELDRRKVALPLPSLLLSQVTISKRFSQEEQNRDENEGSDNENQQEAVSSKCQQMMDSSDAGERCLGSIMALSHILGCLPTLEQWHTYYVQKNLYTGSPELNDTRKARFEDNLAYAAKTFDPSIICKHHTPLEFIDDVRQRISSDEMNECCKKAGYRYKITYVDLEMGAGYVYMACMSNQKMGLELTVPTKGWINYHKYHVKKGTIKRLCTHEKIRAVKLALEKIGYIVCLDKNYTFGCSMRYGLGEKHPRYAEYQLFCKKSEAMLSKTRKSPCFVQI